ncbi:MAG: DUF3999 domain-containing protein, partial [Synergistaceae bacterium]|nr:DUF3999 domain-containing protein [Synergistaceae bacterium]
MNALNRYALFTICFFVFFSRMPASGALSRYNDDAPEPFRIGDFSVKYGLSADIEGRIYRLRLDENIFRSLMQSYERDLAIFNSSGDVIPFTFLPSDVFEESEGDGAQKTENMEEIETISVPLFSLPERSQNLAAGNETVIHTGPDGSIIEIRGAGNPRSPQDTEGVFLLDLTRMRRDDAAGYRIELPLSGESDTVASVNVYASDSLRNWQNRSSWRKIAIGEPFVYLRSGMTSLSSGIIELTGNLGNTNYLILEINGRGDVKPEHALLTLIKKTAPRVTPLDSAVFEGISDTDSSVIYDTSGVFPTAEADFILKTPGIYDAAISSRGTPEDEWRRVANARISLITRPDGESRSGPIIISGRSERYWRLSVRDASIMAPPTLRLFWKPVDVVFMAQGAPPY